MQFSLQSANRCLLLSLRLRANDRRRQSSLVLPVTRPESDRVPNPLSVKHDAAKIENTANKPEIIIDPRRLDSISSTIKRNHLLFDGLSKSSNSGLPAASATAAINSKFTKEKKEPATKASAKKMAPAQTLIKSPFTQFKLNRNLILYELQNPNENAGIKWRRFPALNKILKGHRPGELTIFTGLTGCGKTTLLSELSLDLCEQGVSTLWGNFEIPNIRLMKRMLSQFAQMPLERNLDKFDELANRFQNLPLHFLTYHGEHPFDIVLDSMEQAVTLHGVQHVVIDNLQFMVGTQCEKERSSRPNRYFDVNRNIDKYTYQDIVVGACRRFATQHNCHVTLVIHPRKGPENEPLNNTSIFGSAKAIQEADNILILQIKWKDELRFKKHLQVTKNRYDGDLGIIPLNFCEEAGGFGLKPVPSY